MRKHYKPATEHKIFTIVCSFSFLSSSSVNLLFYDSSTSVACILLLLHFHDLSIYFPKSKYFMFHKQNSLLILMDIALFWHGRDPTVPFHLTSKSSRENLQRRQKIISATCISKGFFIIIIIYFRKLFGFNLNRKYPK